MGEVDVSLALWFSLACPSTTKHIYGVRPLATDHIKTKCCRQRALLVITLIPGAARAGVVLAGQGHHTRSGTVPPRSELDFTQLARDAPSAARLPRHECLSMREIGDHDAENMDGLLFKCRREGECLARRIHSRGQSC